VIPDPSVLQTPHVFVGTALAIVALTSIIDRPFVTCSGVKSFPLLVSLMANLSAAPAWLAFDTIAQLSMSPYFDRMHNKGLGVIFVTLAFYVAVKFLVIRVSARRPIKAWPILAGSVSGLGLICAVFCFLVWLNDENPRLWLQMLKYVPLAYLLSYLLFAAILAGVVRSSLSFDKFHNR